MNISSDFHLHTSFSSDSETPMSSMIEQGIRTGLSYLCFTEHMDKDYLKRTDDDPDFEVDTDAYLTKYRELKEKYKDRITILFGVELGLQPHVADYYRQYTADYPFDFIIGSSHLCHRKDPYFPEFFEGREEHLAYREYFESILENIQTYDGYDIYGHLDYVVRYGPYKNKFYSYQRYADIIDEILRALTASSKGIEINTGGFKYGLGHPNPTEEIIKRYRELGGEIITIGSDAHEPNYIAYDFDKIPSILKNAGFQYYTIFKERKPAFIKL